MDDNDLVRAAMVGMIRALGCDVIEAADGAEAIQRYVDAAAKNEPIDVVIFDLTVPDGMGGAEAIRRLREIDPDVRAIVTSGYCDDPVMSAYRDHGFVGLLHKPMKRADMKRVLLGAYRGDDAAARATST